MLEVDHCSNRIILYLKFMHVVFKMLDFNFSGSACIFIIDTAWKQLIRYG